MIRPNWNPPNTETKIWSLDKSVSCDLSAVLDQTGKKATEFANALEKLPPRKKSIQKIRPSERPKETRSVRSITHLLQDVMAAQPAKSTERNKGSHAFSEAGNDVGEVALALVFHPSLQTDYQMTCEGLDDWRGQHSWVIRFEQRKDRPSRTFQFKETKRAIYSAMLKGRAWVSSENWQILHLEINLTQVPSGDETRRSAMSID